MKRSRLAAVVALLFAVAGCRHARTVDKPGDEKPDRNEVGQGTGGSGGERREKHAEKKKDARAPTEPGRPPLATSPEGLMVPGAVTKLQRALGDRGFLPAHETGDLDEETSAALRRFQEQEGLARTGAPDRETLRKLGLDPKDVFRTTEAN